MQRTDETLVADVDGAIFDNAGGPGDWIAFFQLGLQRDTQDCAGGWIDEKRAVVAGSVLERLCYLCLWHIRHLRSVVVAEGGSFVLEIFHVADAAIVHGVMRHFPRHGIAKDRSEAGGSCFPVGPGQFAFSGIGEDDRQFRAELAPRLHAGFLLLRGGCVGGLHHRGRILRLFAVAKGDLAGGVSGQMETGADGPVPLLQNLGAVVEEKRGTGDEEILHPRPGADHVAASHVEYVRLRGCIGRLGCRQFAGWRIEKGGLVSEQLKRESSVWAERHAGDKAIERAASEPFLEFEIAEAVGDIGVGAMSGHVGRQRLLELGHGEAPGSDCGNCGKGQSGEQNQLPHSNALRSCC